MDFGGDFDDDLFGETKDKSKRDTMPYNAKLCEEDWFVGLEVKDDSDCFSVYKFQAECAYYRRQYDTALQAYDNCLVVLQSGNASVWRDVQEGRTRCLIALNKFHEASLAAQLLNERAQNYEHKTSSLQILALTYHFTQQYQEEIYALQKLLTLHPSNPHIWVQLSAAYINYLSSCCGASNDQLLPAAEKSDLTGIEQSIGDKCIISDSVDTIKCDATHNEGPDRDLSESGDKVLHGGHMSGSNRRVLHTETVGLLRGMERSALADEAVVSTGMRAELVLVTCWIRAQFLMHSIRNTVGGFAKDKNLEAIEQVSECLRYINPTDDHKHTCTQFVRSSHLLIEQDVERLSHTEAPQFLEEINAQSPTTFEKKWFSWAEPTNPHSS